MKMTSKRPLNLQERPRPVRGGESTRARERAYKSRVTRARASARANLAAAADAAMMKAGGEEWWGNSYRRKWWKCKNSRPRLRHEKGPDATAMLFINCWSSDVVMDVSFNVHYIGTALVMLKSSSSYRTAVKEVLPVQLRMSYSCYHRLLTCGST